MADNYRSFADAALTEGRDFHDPTDKFFEAKAHERAIVSMSATSQVLAAAVLWLLWKVDEHGYFEELGEYNFLTDWARDKLLPYYQPRYIRRLVGIVRLFNLLVLADTNGTPHVSPETGEILTPEGLLNDNPGLNRLSAIASAFGFVEDDEESTAHEKQAKLLEAAYAGMEEAEKAGRDAKTGKAEDPIPYYIQTIADGSYSIHIRGLDDRSLRRVEGCMRGIGEQHFE